MGFYQQISERGIPETFDDDFERDLKDARQNFHTNGAWTDRKDTSQKQCAPGGIQLALRPDSQIRPCSHPLSGRSFEYVSERVHDLVSADCTTCG